MVKKIAGVSCGVFLGLVIAFARAGAFPFWSSQQEQSKAPPAPAERSAQAAPNHGPAPANQPEPNEISIPIHSFAPLVKRVMPSVVTVTVVQEGTSGPPLLRSASHPCPDDPPQDP